MMVSHTTLPVLYQTDVTASGCIYNILIDNSKFFYTST